MIKLQVFPLSTFNGTVRNGTVPYDIFLCDVPQLSRLLYYYGSSLGKFELCERDFIENERTYVCFYEPHVEAVLIACMAYLRYVRILKIFQSREEQITSYIISIHLWGSIFPSGGHEKQHEIAERPDSNSNSNKKICVSFCFYPPLSWQRHSRQQLILPSILDLQKVSLT